MTENDLDKLLHDCRKQRRHSLSLIGLPNVPDEVYRFRWLRQLHFYGFYDCELSDKIGDLRNLSVLTIRHCQLQYLPESIVNMRNLRQLSLTSNQLQELPESICKLSNMRWLDIRYNQLRRLPDALFVWQIKNNKKYRYVHLEGNPLTTVGNLQGLDANYIWYICISNEQLERVFNDNSINHKLQSYSNFYNCLSHYANRLQSPKQWERSYYFTGSQSHAFAFYLDKFYAIFGVMQGGLVGQNHRIRYTHSPLTKGDFFYNGEAISLTNFRLTPDEWQPIFSLFASAQPHNIELIDMMLKGFEV